MTPQSKRALKELEKQRNFKSWNFDRIAECLKTHETMRKAMRTDPFYSSRLRAVDPLDERWRDEPDKVQWIDPITDYDCLVVRNRTGSLCGYVGLPPGHPLHGVATLDEVPVDVHGGLTFSGYCAESESPDTICHIPLDGRPDRVYWLGFDCAHAWDLSPGMGFTGITVDETYRDLAYVTEQVRALAVQLKGLSFDGE